MDLFDSGEDCSAEIRPEGYEAHSRCMKRSNKIDKKRRTSEPNEAQRRVSISSSHSVLLSGADQNCVEPATRNLRQQSSLHAGESLNFIYKQILI